MRVFVFFLCFLFNSFELFSQNGNFTAQDLLSNLDKVWDWGSGKMYGKVIINDGQKEKDFEFELFKKQHKSFYFFSNKKNNKKVSQTLYSRFIPEAENKNFRTAQQTIRKEQSFYFDTILGSNFSYSDLSYYKYENFYLPLSVSEIQDKIRLSLAPLKEHQYSKLVIFYNKDSLLPEKIDFYDLNKLLFKSFLLKYDMVNIKKESKSENLYRLKSVIATDLNSGYNSIFEINLINYDVQFLDTIFRFN